MEFYDDLEHFIEDHDDDNIESTTYVSEFELLTHHLLNYREHYTINYDEYQRISHIVINIESTVHDIDHHIYGTSGLESILSEYEDLSEDFELMIRSCFDMSSIKKSDMLYATTEADYFIPLGRSFRIFPSMISSNTIPEVRIPPDKYNASNIGVAYHGEDIQYHHHMKEPPDKSTDLNYTDFGIRLQQDIYGHHNITTEAETSFPLGRVSSLIIAMISSNPMLEIRTPPDKCTVINRLIHQRTIKVIELPTELYDKIRPNQSVDCCETTT